MYGLFLPFGSANPLSVAYEVINIVPSVTSDEPSSKYEHILIKVLYADIVLILVSDSHAAIHWEEVISPSHVRDIPLTALAFVAMLALVALLTVIGYVPLAVANQFLNSSLDIFFIFVPLSVNPTACVIVLEDSPFPRYPIFISL